MERSVMWMLRLADGDLQNEADRIHDAAGVEGAEGHEEGQASTSHWGYPVAHDTEADAGEVCEDSKQSGFEERSTE
jgi:hypothetical protein